MANLGQEQIDFLSGGQGRQSQLYSLNELIPGYDKFVEQLELIRQNRGENIGLFEHHYGVDKRNGFSWNLDIPNPADGSTLREIYRNAGFTEGQLFSDTDSVKWKAQAGLKDAFDEWLTRAYDKDIASIDSALGYTGDRSIARILYDKKTDLLPRISSVERTIANGGHNIYEGRIDPYQFGKLTNKFFEQTDPALGISRTSQAYADAVLKHFQKLLVPSGPLEKRVPIAQILESAKAGRPINGVRVLPYGEGGMMVPPDISLGVPSIKSSSQQGLITALDNGTGLLLPTTYARPGFNSANALERNGNTESQNVNSLRDANIIESAKLYAGQKIAQQHILEGGFRHRPGSSSEEIYNAWLAGSPQDRIDTAFSGQVPHNINTNPSFPSIRTGTLGGFPATPFSSYRAAGGTEFQGALASGQLIQESPSFFVTKDGKLASRPDYNGPRYFNNGENLWNYTVNTGTGGSYNISEMPVVWEVIAGANEQRYPSSQIRVGSMNLNTAKVIRDVADAAFTDTNKALSFSKTAGTSQGILNHINEGILGGVASNPIPLAEQIGASYTVPSSPVNPWDGTRFGIQLHTGVHTGEPLSSAGMNAYQDFKSFTNWEDPSRTRAQSKTEPLQNIFLEGDKGIQMTTIDPADMGRVGQSGLTQSGRINQILGARGSSDDDTILRRLVDSTGQNPDVNNLWQYPIQTPVNWATIGGFHNSDSKVWGLPEVPTTDGRYSGVKHKWATGFEIGDNAGIPSRAFIPVDPSDPTKGWKIGYSNFAQHGLGELDTPLNADSARRYIQSTIDRTPSRSWMSVAGDRNFAENFQRTLGWFDDQKSLVNREAYDWASLGPEEFARRFGIHESLNLDKWSADTPFITGTQSISTNPTLLPGGINPSELSFSLHRPLDSRMLQTINNHFSDNDIIGKFRTWDQLEGFLKSMKANETGIVSSSLFPGIDSKKLTRFVTDLQSVVGYTNSSGDEFYTDKFQLHLRKKDNSAPSNKDMIDREVDRSIVSGDRKGTLVAGAGFGGYSPMSPKASQLRGKEFGTGASPSTEFFDAAQKEHFARIAQTFPDGKIPPNMSAGFSKFAITNKIKDSFVNVAKGIMPSDDVVRFAKMLENPKAAEQLTVGVARFAEIWPKLTDESKALVKELARAKLGELASGFLHKAGTAAAIVTAPIDARHRQKHKMDKFEREIDEMSRQNKSLDMSEAEISALAAMHGVISGLENVPNFLSLGEYDRQMGYRDESVFTMLRDGYNSFKENFPKYDVNPLVMRGRAKAKPKQPQKSSSETIKDLTQ